MAARPPSPRSGQHWTSKRPAASAGGRQRRLIRARASSEKRVWSLYLVWVDAKVALQPTANTKMPLSHFAIFSASFFLTLEPLAAPPQPVTHPEHITPSQPLPAAHLHAKPCPSFRLMSLHSFWSEPFQKDSPEPPCCITAAITGFFADTVWRFSKCSGIQNKIRLPDPATNWATGKALLLRLFVTWWLGDRLKFSMNMDMTVYASRRKISSTYLAGKYLYEKILECFWRWRLYICFVKDRWFLSSVWAWTVSSYYLKKDYMIHLALISIWIGVNLFCSAQYHIEIRPL